MDEKDKIKKSDFLPGVLGALLWALVLTGLSLVISSFVYLHGDLSDGSARSIVTASALLSVFLSSAISGRKMRHKGLFMGIMVGILYSLCLYLTGFMAFGFSHFSKGLFSAMALCILCGALGGIVGVNLKSKK